MLLISLMICIFIRYMKTKKNRKIIKPTMASDYTATASAAAVMKMEEERELEEKVKKVQLGKSGCLVFSAGEVQHYSLEQLMRASAELLGKGTIGTTYKAVLDNRLIVCVKRLDGLKLAGTSREAFDRQMEAVGGLRHPNLVALRAYFQAKEERLLVYDYQPNGSLFSLIHGKFLLKFLLLISWSKLVNLSLWNKYYCFWDLLFQESCVSNWKEQFAWFCLFVASFNFKDMAHDIILFPRVFL